MIWVVFRYVSEFIDRLKLKEFDRQIGALFGFAKGVLICVILTVFLVSLVDGIREPILRSYSAYYVAVFLDKAHVYLPEDIHDKLEPVIHSLDERLGNQGTAHQDETATIRSPEDAREAVNSYVDSIGERVTDRVQQSVTDEFRNRFNSETNDGSSGSRVVPFDELRQAFEKQTQPSTNTQR